VSIQKLRLAILHAALLGVGYSRCRHYSYTAFCGGSEEHVFRKKKTHMKNIQIIDGAENTVYDIFAATDDEFAIIFPSGQDIAFIEEVVARNTASMLGETFKNIWMRRLHKNKAMGIHGILFYGLDNKMKYYPTRKDEEASNPDGSRLR
jgi:hypothetical protein